MVVTATTSAPVNIACIKYWGKRDTKLILPTNSSLSVTLDQDHLRSTTSSATDATFEKDRLWLNAEEELIKEGGRLDVCIKEMKKLRAQEEEKDSSLEKLSTFKVHIASYNNFPTAAGLASSASGLAALVSSLASLYSLPTNPSQLSLIARQGSGSACRSLFGGFVAWEQGSLPTGLDSYAVEIAPRSHWPTLHALICVVSDVKKTTASTAGMQLTVETSALLQDRIQNVVPKRMEAIIEAIKSKDFDSFAQITMKDSNQFHAVCLDTFPPIFYLNDVSKAIIAVVTELNRVSLEAGGPYLAAYTFDAGPNAVIYAEEANMSEIISLVQRFFPVGQAFEDPFGLGEKASAEGGAGLRTGFREGVSGGVWAKGSVSRLIHTRIGDGPRVLGEEESLLNKEGLPKKVKA
ncbi:Diphosphomevalonate decarboxylase [Mrakia frigida]|uniref:diphosphomevalonate decarboxylase MVD1 n=1 Tax=Mrakia frigida TaxID=29902 RepID=UPI003FCBF145